MSYQRDREEFVAVLLTEPGWIGVSAQAVRIESARSILKYAATLQRLAVKGCNEGTTADDDMKCMSCEQKIRALASAFGAEAHFQGDPRGACVKLKLPSGRGNCFGEPGLYCVPTRRF